MNRLIQNYDDDWFVCPTDKLEAAAAYFHADYFYWKMEHDYFTRLDKSPAQPAYLVRIYSPNDIEFENYKVDE